MTVSNDGPVLINLTHLTPTMAGVLRHSAGLVGALLRRDDDRDIRIVTTEPGLEGLRSFGLDLPHSKVTVLPATIGRSKLAAAIATLTVVPMLARRRRASTILNLDYYFSPAPRGARTISLVTDVQFLDRPSNFGKGARWSRSFFLRLASRSCDVVLGISQTSTDRFVEVFPAAAGRTRIVPMGLDEPAGPAPTTRDGRALFVGTTNDHKNLAVVIDAIRAELLPGIEVVVAGRPGSYEPSLRAALDEPTVGNQLRRLGRISDPDLDDLYGSVSTLIAPSLYEGFDMPTLEAMAAGADVVASDLPVHREILGSHAEYFDPTDPTSLALAIADANQRSDEQRAAAVAHARSFTWDRSAERLAAVL